MPSSAIDRPISESEKNKLEEFLASIPSDSLRWQAGAKNAIVAWSALMLLISLVWLTTAWIVNWITGVNFGLHSEHAVTILATTAMVVAAVTFTAFVKGIRSWKSPASEVRQELKSGTVREDRLEIVAVKRFQEQEHGGLIYFLLTTDQQVMAMYDAESQDLGVNKEDPLSSSFTVRQELTIVRTPIRRMTLDTKFSGKILNAGSPIELTVTPNMWPEDAEFCQIKWEELESHYSKSVGSSA